MDSNNQLPVLTVACPERNGIVLAVSDVLNRQGATIVEAAQHRGTLINQFLMRVEFEFGETDCGETNRPDKDTLLAQFSSLAEEFQMHWQLYDLGKPTRILFAVSGHGHCLNDLLHRWESGPLPIEIASVYFNHDRFQTLVDWSGLPFFLPDSKETKSQQEDRVLESSSGLEVDLIVMARLLQNLSPKFYAGLTDG